MPDTSLVLSDPSVRNTPPLARLVPLLLLAALLGLAPLTGFLPSEWYFGPIVVGVSLFSVALIVVIKGWVDDRAAQQVTAVLSAFAEQDELPCLIANAQGDVLVVNRTARSAFMAEPGMALTRCVSSVFANPPAILLRLQTLAQDEGGATEEFVTSGSSVFVTVTRIGADVFCWRFRLNEAGAFADLNLPVLTEGRNGVLLRLNKAGEDVLGHRPGALAEVFPDGVPAVGQIGEAQSRGGSVPVSVIELSRFGAGRNLLLFPLSQAPDGTNIASVSGLPVPVVLLTPDGVILEVNPLANRLLGDVIPGETNISRIMQGLSHPILDWLARTALEDKAPRSEFLRLSRRDKEVFVQVTLSRICTEGEPRLIAILNDATELKTLEAQFVQGQKMQAVGQLAGGVAHDFNNLLTAISGHCDLLLLRHDQNDPDYGDLIQINQNANRAAALVSQLLAFSRKQTLRPQVLDVRDTISDLIHLLNRLVGEKVQLTLSHDPVLKPVRADKRQLEQVLMNLVVNARDAMPDGGEIRIETEVLNLTQPYLRDRATLQPGEYVTVKVIDSGVGIPADKLQKVFEPFYTTKRTGEGTGLGLSTAYGIVKQTGGFIFVDSFPGRGTEFTVFLPVCAQETTAQPVAEERGEAQGARQGEGVVLLVEDEAPVRAFATRALRLKGYTVLEAESAEDALQLLEDPGLTVDVFVTDVVMPGMDGPTWVRKALKTRPDVRVVFVSGYTEGAFGDAGPQVANSVFLPKPFSLNQLTEAVFQQLN